MKKSETDLREKMCPAFGAAISSGEDDGVELANHLIEDAVAARATDIHLDPQRESYLVRFRVDGQLYAVAKMPRPSGEALARSIEVDAAIDPATRAERMEGTAQFGPRETSARVAYATTVQGPKLSLRLLEASHVQHDVRELGMEDQEEKDLLQWAENAEGMMLCVGPTGCGKTTTCYSLLNEMKQHQRNILTLEDPVEFVIDGLSQIGLDADDRTLPATFADGIRGVLRHDPDTIFLGEIRDESTAHAAIDASFSGHVLLSTMHSRDPAGAITLLRSMGAKDYEIAASVKMIVGQRIVRLLCEECKKQRKASDAESEAAKDLGAELDSVWTAEGCEKCSGTGYGGLSAIFELWRLEDEDYSAILAHDDENKLRSRLRDRGVMSLAASALEKVRNGETSLTEVIALR